MKGYSGYKFGEAKPFNPFEGGGSTFTGAKPPEWLSGLSRFASPQEWESVGTAFIQDPRILERRARLYQLGKQIELESEEEELAKRNSMIPKPQMGRSYPIPTGYAPNWTQSYQTPKFPWQDSQANNKSK